ncbi:MAG: transglutaminase domain-containing protein [Saonia sp.]
MIIGKVQLFSILALFGYVLSAQEVKFGKVSKEELSETFYEKDSAASAAVLYREVSISYKYMQDKGFSVHTQVHERVKIYNKDGFDYATVSERLYKDGGTKETLGSVKAFTYSLENDQIVKSKLKSSETFTTSLSKYRNEEKFTMPNIKEGSVIEYEYRITSPFSYTIDEIVLQYDIPIKKQHVSIATPEYYSFKPNMKGYLSVVPKYSSASGKITFSNKERSESIVATTKFSNSSLDYKINKTTYEMTYVPALKAEPYVNDMNNYRSSVNYELQFVKFPNATMKSYTTNWEKVVKTIYKSDNFGKQLEYTKYFKDVLPTILNGTANDKEKIGAIFSHVQQHMNWNGYYGKYTDKGVRDAYKEKTGNVAEINLMLVAMYRAAGLQANPVLISTRDNGVPLLPTREGFNYVVASVELDDKTILLDACNKFTTPNLLPTKALNWFGRVIKEDGTSTSISVLPKRLSKEINMLNIALKSDGIIEGKMRKTHTDYNAYIFRNKYSGVSEEDYLEKLEHLNADMEISNYKVDNKSTKGKPIRENFDFYMEDQVDIIGDKIYFSPLFFNTGTENPFKLEKRNYPIDFAYPWQEKYIISMLIPEGYQVTSIPENVNLALENNMGSFVYKIVDGGNNMIQVIADLKMNSAVIPAQNYAGVKELYKKMVEKETEKVVLSKI